MFTDADRARLLEMLQRHAVLRGDFVLSSGQRASYYIDARRVTLSAQGSPLVGAAFLQAFGAADIGAVAGLTMGADPIVTAIAVRAGLQGHGPDALIVRKEAKDHGAGKRIEGPWREGLRVAIVDDTSTTGASSLNAARAVAEAGGEVVGIWQLIDRKQGAREAASKAGFQFASIFTADDVLG